MNGLQSGRGLCVVGAALAMLWSSTSALAAVNLELRPAESTVAVGQTFGLGLYVVSDDPIESEFFAALEVIFTWDPNVLQLQGLDSTGGTDLLSSSIPFPDIYNINNANPPTSGIAYYFAFAPLGARTEATPEGTLVTTFVFHALQETALTTVQIIPAAGSPTGFTAVFDGFVPNLDITGTLGSADVTVVEPMCAADVNNDGEVNVLDLIAVIGAWGICDDPPAICPADTNRDGVVDVLDLIAVIKGWGLCPG